MDIPSKEYYELYRYYKYINHLRKTCDSCYVNSMHQPFRTNSCLQCNIYHALDKEQCFKIIDKYLYINKKLAIKYYSYEDEFKLFDSYFII